MEAAASNLKYRDGCQRLHPCKHRLHRRTGRQQEDAQASNVTQARASNIMQAHT